VGAETCHRRVHPRRPSGGLPESRPGGNRSRCRRRGSSTAQGGCGERARRAARRRAPCAAPHLVPQLDERSARQRGRGVIAGQCLAGVVGPGATGSTSDGASPISTAAGLRRRAATHDRRRRSGRPATARARRRTTRPSWPASPAGGESCGLASVPPRNCTRSGRSEGEVRAPARSMVGQAESGPRARSAGRAGRSEEHGSRRRGEPARPGRRSPAPRGLILDPAQLGRHRGPPPPGGRPRRTCSHRQRRQRRGPGRGEERRGCRLPRCAPCQGVCRSRRRTRPGRPGRPRRRDGRGARPRHRGPGRPDLPLRRARLRGDRCRHPEVLAALAQAYPGVNGLPEVIELARGGDAAAERALSDAGAALGQAIGEIATCSTPRSSSAGDR